MKFKKKFSYSRDFIPEPTGRQKIKSVIMSFLLKKSEKLTTRQKKREENLFSPMNLDPPPHKNSFY
jgi:hypothetical protein